MEDTIHTSFKATIHTIRFTGESSVQKKNFGDKYIIFTVNKDELPEKVVSKMPIVRGGFNKNLIVINGYSKEALEEGGVVKLNVKYENVKYDTQYKCYSIMCDSIEKLHEVTEAGFLRYLGKKYKGIGPKKAEKIFDYLTNEYGIDRTTEFKTLFLEGFITTNDKFKKYLGVKNYDKIQEQVLAKETNDEIKLTDDELVFSTEYNINPNTLLRLKKNIIKLSLYNSKYNNKNEISYQDHNVITYYKKNPYLLAIDSKLKGLGFKKIDKQVFQILNETERGTKEFISQRMIGLLKYVLVKKIESGHLFIDKEIIFKEFNLINQENPERSFELPELEIELFEELVFLINNLEQVVNPFIVYDEKIFLKNNLKMELLIATRLLNMNNVNINANRALVESTLKSVEPKEWQLSEEQRKAVIDAICNPVSIITGGPGTGKTTISTMVVKVLKKMGKSVKILAPTGTASKRISTVVGMEATTIHRGLGFKGHFEFNINNPLKEEVIIIDESSMIDVIVGKALVDASVKSQIIFIGDVNQLPSVGPGDFLRDLINSNKFQVSKLTKVFRQAEDNPIIQFAYKVLNGEKIQSFFEWYTKKNDILDMKLSIPFKDQFKSSIDGEENPAYLNNMVDFVIENGIKSYLIHSENFFETQILVASNRANDRINNELQRVVNDKGVYIPNSTFKIGDKIIQIKNNYKFEIFNGSIGFIYNYNDTTEEVGIKYIENPEKILYLPKSVFVKENKLCYSMTIHKSQGQEFKRVIMLVNDFMLNNREMLYTGATRAKEYLTIVSNTRLLTSGISTTNRKEVGQKNGKQARNTYLINFLDFDLNKLNDFYNEHFKEESFLEFD